MYHHNFLYELIRLITPLIKQALPKIKNGSLQFNIGTDGIFVNYQPEANSQPLQISIPFKTHHIESQA